MQECASKGVEPLPSVPIIDITPRLDGSLLAASLPIQIMEIVKDGILQSSPLVPESGQANRADGDWVLSQSEYSLDCARLRHYATVILETAHESL
jgi:hypothetical protein